MQFLPTLHARLVLVMLAFMAWPCRADVVILVNRTGEPVQLTTRTSSSKSAELTLSRGELITIPMRGTADLTCRAAAPSEYKLLANEAYYFERRPGESLTLRQIDLGGDVRSQAGRELVKTAQEIPSDVIPVKILVDDEEKAVREVWEQRLRKRLAAASGLFEKMFHVRFEVVATETWHSGIATTSFRDAGREFERVVDPKPARLAIGFSSQFSVLDTESMSDSISVPLHSHLLIGEQSGQHTEVERLELLIHRLGHYLGAAHSPESDSVMRVWQGDGLVRRADFSVRFDPVNAIVIYLVAEELRYRRITQLSQLSPGSLLRIRQLYGVLADVLPNDPIIPRFRDALPIEDERPKPDSKPPQVRQAMGIGVPEPRVTAARSVLQQITEYARRNASAIGAHESKERRRTGDELTIYLIRKAAQAAQEVERDHASHAFLLAIGLGLDDSDYVRKNPLMSELCHALETNGERAERIKVLGQPTVFGRRDLAQHFVVSSFLAAAYGPGVADAAGVAKEVMDAQIPSGFSFVDLAADRAGVALAVQLLEGKLSLAEIAENFSIHDFVPAIDDLPEGLSWESFLERYGSITDRRFQRETERINHRLQNLNAYQNDPR